MNRDGETPWRVDDMRDDAAAAYKEVLGRINDDGHDDEPAPAPAAKEPVEPDTRSEDRPRDPVTKRFVRGTPPAKEEPLHPTTDKPVTAKTTEKKAAVEEKPDEEGETDPAAKPVVGGPPPSFSVKSKAGWDQLPDYVRADIVKREAEMQNGLAALRDFKDLKPYAELATKHNTTIKDYVDRTLRIENLLKQDLGAGISFLVQNAGYDQARAAQFFAGLAQKFGAQVPAGGAQPGQQQPAADPLAEMLKPLLAPIVTQLGELKTAQQSRAEADRNAQMQSLESAITTFASDPANKFFPDLEETITQLFEKGMIPLTGNHAADLKAAYDMAARMNPAVHEALIEQRLTEQKSAERQKEQDKVAKARAASRSVSGSRIPGSSVVKAEEQDDDDDDIEAQVRKAYRQHAQT